MTLECILAWCIMPHFFYPYTLGLLSDYAQNIQHKDLFQALQCSRKHLLRGIFFLVCNLWLVTKYKDKKRACLHSETFSYGIEVPARKNVRKQKSSPTSFLHNMWQGNMLSLFRSSIKVPALEGLGGNKRSGGVAEWDAPKLGLAENTKKKKNRSQTQ